jgi:hypothetical protein
MLRLDKPGRGVAARGAFDIGGQSMIVRTVYHFGHQPAETGVRRRRRGKCGFENASRCRREEPERSLHAEEKSGVRASSAACLVVAHAYHAFPRSLWRADAGPSYLISW